MSATVVHSIPAHGIIFLIDDCNAHGKSKYGNFTLHEKRIKKNNCHFLLDLALETHRVITNTRLQKKVCKLWFYVCAKNIKKQVSWLHRGQTKVKKNCWTYWNLHPKFWSVIQFYQVESDSAILYVQDQKNMSRISDMSWK